MEKIWLKSYQEGVPYTINADEYASLAALFEETCSKYKNLTAYVNMNEAITYQELYNLSGQFACYLQELRLPKGARVALMMPNILQYPIALFGSLRAGYVVVNTNPLYTADEIIHQLNDAGADVLVVLSHFAHTIEKALPHIRVKHIIITEIGDVFPFFKRVIVNGVIKYIKQMIPAYHLPNVIKFRDILTRSYKQSPKPVSLSHDDLAFLQYTGGTTGVAKGAMLTHGNMVANILQAAAFVEPLNLGSQDVIVTALPLYHIFSLTANALVFFKFGAKNILITNPRDLPRFIHDIKKARFTAITGVNTLFNALLNAPGFNKIDTSCLKLALSGGMALQESVAKRWVEKTHAPILEAYGLTEASPAVTINPLSLKTYNGSIGLPLPSTDIAIRDEYNQDVALNMPGELCIKGPQIMLGYWGCPEETDEIFTPDGYLKTGDIARMDEKGFIYLVDRKKNMILVSGFNVYPTEIEQVISQMPDVFEVGVIGIKDKQGERVKACIVKRNPKLTEADVISYCRDHLTAYKVPKEVEFFVELPKTNVGKILHRALREREQNNQQKAESLETQPS